MSRFLPVGFVLRMLQYVLVGAALVYITVEQSQQADDLGLVIAAACLVAFFGPLDGLVRSWTEYYGLTAWEFSRRFEVAANGAFVVLTKVTSIPWEELGITVFAVRRSRRHPFRGKQHRVYRLRMSSKPQPTNIVWTYRKGLLGMCWRDRRDVDLDHQAVFGRYAAVSRKEWKKVVPAEVRDHLTYEDFKDIRDFGYVLAIPARDDHKYRGCLVVQVKPEYRAQLAEGTVARTVLHHAARTVADLLSR